MDIVFTHKTQSCYREFADPVKRVQVSAESVVPDTNEDIGRIAAVRSQVLLKSKDVTSRSVMVTGELETVLLYITEDEKSVSSVRLRKEFSLELDDEEYPLDTLAQIRLSVSNTEARVLNPRKVSVTVELLAELYCYTREEFTVETRMPEEGPLLHGRTEELEAFLVNGVGEKSFVLSEQFRFPDGKPAPVQLVAQNVDFVIEDVQQVGSRAVVKGRAMVDVCYLSEDRGCPQQARFTTLFSQILDTGAEECVSGTAFAELTGAYFDLVDTISGEKAMDAELHAVLQLVSRSRKEICCLTDLYSNRFPTECSFQEQSLPVVSEEQRLRLRAEEELSIAEDCEEILSVHAAVTSCLLTEGLPALTVGLDVIYRRRSGELSAVRRQMELKGDRALPGARLYGARILQTDYRSEGGVLHLRAEAELSWQSFRFERRRTVAAVTLREEEPYNTAQFPTVTLVRTGTEPLWELARRYHSSVEAIRSMREALGEEDGGVLLIPRED